MPETTQKRTISLSWIILTLSVLITIFQIYTAATLPLQTFAQRSLHLTFMYPIAFLVAAQKSDKRLLRALLYLCAVASIVVFLYVFFNWQPATRRLTALLPIDYVLAIITIVLVLFVSYLSIGIWMPLIGFIFILYAYFGPSIRGIMYFRAISLQRFLSNIYYSEDGIFGMTVGVSATYVFIFVLFGECLMEFGGGQFIIDLAQAAFGKFRGGCAKIAVITAALFGMVSGASPVIVAGTGPFTIPLIKKSGYSGEYAGGVVAAAAVGGLIMPPVMGAAAFVMADALSMSYGEICVKSAICAILYFGTLFLAADLRAVKIGDKGVPKDQLPQGKKVFQEGWHHLISIVLLVYLLCFLQWSPSKSAFWASVALIIAYYAKGFFNRQRFNLKEQFKRLINISVRTCHGMITCCVACSCAGIITGTLSATGLSLRLSGILVQLAGGNLLLLLILVLVCDIILGMGLPALSCYIILSVMVAPALIQLGVSAFAAHMFVFYFGIMSSITPPVGLAFYVASGIAGSDPMRTGFSAWRFALAGFILPFVFIYDSALLLNGTVPQIIWVIFTSIVGLSTISFSLEGYLYGIGHIGIVSRTLLIVASIITIVPEIISTLVGLGILACVFAVETISHRVQKRSA
jgi:TRAP transporter 4TM/12TM fusion protein